MRHAGPGCEGSMRAKPTLLKRSAVQSHCDAVTAVIALPFMTATTRIIVMALTLGAATAASAAEAWKPAAGPLMTRWAKDVNPAAPLPEYPRPQMVRKEWVNLNGLWDYAIAPKADAAPKDYQGKILVPFCVESALSGVMKPVGAANKLWYRRTFERPQNAGRLLLHFGAVDWETTVWVNGKEIGTHRGGYDPFS